MPTVAMVTTVNNNNNNNNNYNNNNNCSIVTDKTIFFNRPDITFMNKKTKNAISIDTAVPNTHNLLKTITDRQNKYRELTNEICAMWKQKAAQVIPILILSMGSNSKVTVTKSNKT